MWWCIKQIWADLVCWVFWHKHETKTGHWCTYCQRCGEHSDEHSML